MMMHHHLQQHHHHHQCWPYPYLHDHGWLTGGRRFRPCVSSPPGFYFMERLKDFTQLCGMIKEVLDFFLLLLRNICSSEIFAFHHHHHTLHHHHRHHHLKAIVGPASKFHDTGLLVEGEVLDVHLKVFKSPSSSPSPSPSSLSPPSPRKTNDRLPVASTRLFLRCTTLPSLPTSPQSSRPRWW